VDVIRKLEPNREVLVDYAEGLKECKKMLMLARAGKRNGYLLEGMGCPGGCIAGAGTLQPVVKSTATVNKYKNEAKGKNALDSKYFNEIKNLNK